MRNSRTDASPATRYVMPVLLVAALAALSGCAGEANTKQNLAAGYDAFNSQQYDDAIARADTQLAKDPRGKGSAEALYLRGRALEQRAKNHPTDARNDLAAARQAYVDALAQKPASQLDAYIRTSLANVAYWQDDFTTAQQQWTAAYGKLGTPDTDPFILYRIGLCQQRLGQFDDADKTFAAVVERYPQTEAADRAKSHSGFRAFTVQLATFADAKGAERAESDLRREGVAAARVVDPRGRHVLSVGPVPTYAAAQQLRTRFTARYPDALIVP